MNDKNILELKDISVSFDGETILDKLNLSIKDGEFVTFLGASGCGKTTTLRVIAGFISPDSGDVFFDGKRINDLPPYKRQVNTIFQRYALFPHLNVYENVAFAMRVTNIAEDKIKKRVPYVLGLVGLADKADRLPDEISGGEQQRVALARALVHSPQLIIADEPTGNIDPKLSVEMMELLKAINSVGITVVVVTHEVALAKRFGKRIITLDHGVVASDAAPAPMEDDEEVAAQ